MIESNKLMAKFLGWKVDYGDKWITNHNQVEFEYDFQFDTDWNWLMSVVEKIEDLGFTVHIGGHMCKIENIEQMIKAITLQPTKIQAVYSACLQFIQNENK